MKVVYFGDNTTHSTKVNIRNNISSADFTPAFVPLKQYLSTTPDP